MASQKDARYYTFLSSKLRLSTSTIYCRTRLKNRYIPPILFILDLYGALLVLKLSSIELTWHIAQFVWAPSTKVSASHTMFIARTGHL